MKVREYMRESLEHFGLTEGEAAVYCAILQSGNGACVEQIRQEAKLSTSGAYKIANALADKGFVVPVKKNGSTSFTAVTLDKAAQKLAAKGRKFTRMSEKFRELQTLAKVTEDTDVYEGNDLTDYYLSIPHQINDFIWCVGSFEAVMNFFGSEVERDFIMSRVRKGKSADAVIFDDSLFSKELVGRDVGEKRETRLIPHSNYPRGFSYLFGNVCLDFYKDAEHQVKVLKTESPDLARARLIQYQTLWNSTAK
jgi:sugar-specific transcriptional regulator TrmB